MDHKKALIIGAAVVVGVICLVAWGKYSDAKFAKEAEAVRAHYARMSENQSEEEKAKWDKFKWDLIDGALKAPRR
jgi:hypothetical protein